MENRFEVLDKGWIELQGILGSDLEIVNAARTSYLGESKGEEADKKLLFYLIKNRHFTPLEMATIKIRVNMPEVVARQWVRHRSMSFNAQCLTGDTEITFNKPDRWRKGKHCKQSGNKGQKFTIKRLYELWNNNVFKSKIENMLIRIYNENTKEFDVSNIEDIFYNGSQDVFEVEMANGKK